MIYRVIHRIPSCWSLLQLISGLDVIKLEYSLKLKIKHSDCPQAANHCLILSLKVFYNLQAWFINKLLIEDNIYLIYVQDKIMFWLF